MHFKGSQSLVKSSCVRRQERKSCFAYTFLKIIQIIQIARANYRILWFCETKMASSCREIHELSGEVWLLGSF